MTRPYHESAMVFGMRFGMIFLCLAMAGCFRTIDSGRSGPGVFVRDAGPRFDSGPRFGDVGPNSDVPFRWFDSAVPDSAVPDSAVPDAVPGRVCPQCDLDSDCPQPPPFGCGQAVCVAGICTVGTGTCGEGEACDQDELICTPESIELRVTLQTDYEPFEEFDRVVLKVDDVVVYQDTELTGDPIAGFVLAPIFVGQRDELRLEATLYQGCNEVDSRVVFLTGSFGPTFSLTLIVTRPRP